MKYLLPLGIYLLLFSSAYSQNSYQVTKTRPPSNDLSAYTKIAVGNFVNPDNAESRSSLDFSEELTSKLLANKSFEVIDKQVIEKMLKDQQKSAISVLDETTISAISDQVGSAIVVVGRIQSDKGKQELMARNQTLIVNDCYTKYFYDAEQDFSVNIKAIDASSGKLLFAQTVGSKQTKTGPVECHPTPPKVDLQELYKICLVQSAANFLRLIAPYEETITITLSNDLKFRNIPNIISFIAADDWETAYQMAKENINIPGLKPKPKAKAYFNLGLMKLFNNEYDEARAAFREAMMLDPKDEAYSRLYKRVDSEYELDQKVKAMQKT